MIARTKEALPPGGSPVASLLFAIPYMGMMALSVLYPYFRIVRLPWFTMHAMYALIICMAILWVFLTGNASRVKRALVSIGLYGGLYVMLLAYSLGIWITSLDGMSLIKRGVGIIAYQLLGITAVAAAYTLFGRKAIRYTFFGMVGGNLLLLANGIYQLGAGEFISQLLSFYMSMGDADTMASRLMEVHDLTFAFGEFVIFFLIFDKGEKGRILCLIVAIGFFLLGWKRIAIPGILLAALYTLWMRRQTGPRAVRLTGWIGLGMLVFGYAYIVIIRAGLYAAICNALGIDTMGRIELLGFIKNYYSLSPIYMGYGVGFITRMMQDFIESGRAVLNAAQSIHNDILARYIEFGFLGFMAWAVYYFIVTARFIFRHWSREAGTLFFSALLFCFITYLTDNTVGYFHINFCLRLFPLAYVTESAAVKKETL